LIFLGIAIGFSIGIFALPDIVLLFKFKTWGNIGARFLMATLVWVLFLVGVYLALGHYLPQTTNGFFVGGVIALVMILANSGERDPRIQGDSEKLRHDRTCREIKK